MTMETAAQKPPITFPCPSCGGQMLFHSEGQNLKCQYCGREEAIEDSEALPEELDLDLSDADEEDAGLTDWGVAKQTIHCESCGGESLIPELETAALCAFCGSPKILVQGDTVSIKPQTMIPFQISIEKAIASFKTWRTKRWFVPNEFKKANISSRLTGVYIPYWTFDSQTDSVYTAERGDHHYRTETKTRVVNGKTETYTTQVRYTTWRWVSGEYDHFFDDLLIPASARYDGTLLKQLDDFNLKQLTEYKPEYLSGYIAERYSVSRREGWRIAKGRIDAALRQDIQSRIGGDEIRGLQIRTQYGGQTYKHILLPLWNAHYTYKGKPYRYMVNAQTGEVSGTFPRSPYKITLAILFSLAAVLAVYFFFMR